MNDCVLVVWVLGGIMCIFAIVIAVQSKIILRYRIAEIRAERRGYVGTPPDTFMPKFPGE